MFSTSLFGCPAAECSICLFHIGVEGQTKKLYLESVFSFEFSTHNCVSRPQELPTKYELLKLPHSFTASLMLIPRESLSSISLTIDLEYFVGLPFLTGMICCCSDISVVLPFHLLVASVQYILVSS